MFTLRPRIVNFSSSIFVIVIFGDLELGVSDEGNNKTGLKEKQGFNARLCSTQWRKNVNLITYSQLFNFLQYGKLQHIQPMH